MPYNITLSNGTELITGGLLDNTTDSANSSLTLVGKNFKSYGLFLNQNFVRLMENFALATAPTAPIPGQLWFNSTTKILNVNVGSTKGTLNAVWKTLAGMTYSSSIPNNPFLGEQWYDSVNGQLNIFNGTEWRLIGPLSRIETTTTGAIPDTISDAPPSTQYVVIKFLINNVLVAIWSNNGPFASDVPGFPTIQKGLNLSNLVGHKFYGDAVASDNINVNGIPVAGNAFLRNDTSGTISGALSLVSDSGLTLGVANDFVANVVGGNVILKNQTNNRDFILSLRSSGSQTPFFRGNFQTALAESYQNVVASSPPLSYVTKNYVDILGGSITGVANFSGNITPSSNVSLTLGNTTNRWNNIFSQSILVGNLNAANTFATISNVASLFLGADIIPTANVSSNVGSAGMRFNTLHAAVVSLSGLLSVGTSANIGTNTNIGQNLAVGGTINSSGTAIFGSNLNVAGNIISSSTTPSNSTGTGAFVLPGGAGISGALYVGGNVVATSTTAATNTTSGAIVVQGGIGVGGAIITGGNIVAASGTASTNNNTGALVVNGGIGVSGSINNGGIIVSGGNIVALSGIASTNTTTGALVVLGGAGISGVVNTGSNVNVGSNLTALGVNVSGNLIVGSNIFAATGSFSGNITASNLTTSSAAVSGNLNVGGVLTAITMPVNTSNTAVATTAFAQAVIPTGGLMMWAANAAPTGWLLCNGSAVSRTSFAALFAVIGTTFGAGDNSTTFNLPNYNNRGPVGAGGLYALGTTGGSKDAIVVSHTHTATGTFVTGIPSNSVNVDSVIEGGFANVIANISPTLGSASVSTVGASGTDANMPPYLAINFIIKT